jgi:hypothetical protein
MDHLSLGVGGQLGQHGKTLSLGCVFGETRWWIGACGQYIVGGKL